MKNKPQMHHTDDPAFSQLLKMLYRGTQLRHHAGNWSTLPGRVEQRITQLFQYLTPPVPTAELKAQLDSVMISLKSDIRSTILTHLNIQTDINNNKLKQATIQESDRKAASELAERVIMKKFGRKASKQQLSEWLAADLSVVGPNHSTTTSSTSASSTSATSSTTSLTSHQTVDSSETVPASAATSIAEEVPDKSQASRKRRRHSDGFAVPVLNRFSPLPVEPTELDEPVDSADTVTNPSKILATSPTNNNRNAENNNNNDTINTDTDLNDDDTWSMTSSQCDQILSSQQSSNPSNQSSSHPVQVFVHDNQPKCRWKLQVNNSPSTVLLTDSNFRLANDIPIPEDWEIHVYPGNSFLNTANLLKTADIPNCVKNIVLAVGINHRGWSFCKSVRTDWNKMLAQTNSLKPAIHFLGVSTASPNETIKTINEEGKKRFGGKFIPALPEAQVTISPTDPFKIHHDKVTVEKIINSIKIHLN